MMGGGRSLEGAEGVAEAGQARLPVGGEALDGLEDVLAVHVGLLDHIVLHANLMKRKGEGEHHK